MVQFPKDYKLQNLTNSAEMRRAFCTNFYFPNMCHICHSLESNSLKLKRCASCNMISYCNKNHQSAHWIFHQDLCKEISNLLKNSNTTNLFNFMRKMDDPIQILQKKKSLMEIMKKKLRRDLLGYEKMMFLFPRVCCVCLESNPDLLVNCKFCPQGSFCEKHQNDPSHAEVCSYTKLCYTLNWCDIASNLLTMSITAYEHVPFLREYIKLPKNMKQFLEDLKLEVPLFWRSLSRQDVWMAHCSQFFTESLTLMNVMEKLTLNVESDLIVHVIGFPKSKQFSITSLEILLHFLPQLMNLQVIVISKNLFNKMEEKTYALEICKLCRANKKNFFLKGIRSTYSSFVNSRTFCTPNIICSYDYEDDEFPLTKESVFKLRKIKAPLVVTQSCKSRALKEQKRLNDIFSVVTSKAVFKKNPFASTLPSRDLDYDVIRIPNNYFAVYNFCATEIENQLIKNEKNLCQIEEKFSTKYILDSTDEPGNSNNPVQSNDDDHKSKRKWRENKQVDTKEMENFRASNSAKEKEEVNLDKELQSKNRKSKTEKATSTMTEYSSESNSEEMIREQPEEEIFNLTVSLATVNMEENEEKPQENSSKEESKHEVPHLIKQIDHNRNSKSKEESMDSAESNNEKSQESSQGNSDNNDKSTDEVSKTENSGTSKSQTSNQQDLNSTTKKTKSKGNKGKSKGRNCALEDKENDQVATNNESKKSEEQLSTSMIEETKVNENKGKSKKNKTGSSKQEILEPTDIKKTDSQHSFESKENKESDNKIEEKKEENKPGKKKKKSKSQKGSPSKNSEVQKLSNNQDIVASASKNLDQTFETLSLEEKETFKQTEPSSYKNLLGATGLTKRPEELIEENKQLSYCINILSGDFELLKNNGKLILEDLLSEVRSMRECLAYLEECLTKVSSNN